MGQVRRSVLVESFQDRRPLPSEQLAGIVIYRFESALFFADAPYFAERVRSLGSGVE